MRSQLEEIAARFEQVEDALAKRGGVTYTAAARPPVATLNTHELVARIRDTAEMSWGATQRLNVLRSHDLASWFADNAWCLKCNVFGASPCAADYMAFNVLLESNPSEAEEARIVTFFGSAISQCLRSDPDILSKKRLGAAERKAAEHVAGLRKKLGLPEPSSGLSTTELIGDIHRRLRIISGSVESMLPPPWLRQPQAAAAAPPSLSTKDSVSQLLGRLRELDADMTAIRDGLR